MKNLFCSLGILSIATASVFAAQTEEAPLNQPNIPAASPSSIVPTPKFLGNGGDLFTGTFRVAEDVVTETDEERVRHREALAEAMLQQRRGFLAVALKSLDEALAADPNSHVALVMAAEICFQDDPTRAQGYLDRAFQIQPDYYRLHLVKAMLYKKSGKYEEALEALNRTLELKPTHTDARKDRADFLVRKTDSPDALRQAIEDYQVLQQALPQQSPLWNYYIGLCYFHLKEFERAVKILEPLIGLAPNGEPAYLLGKCKEELGDYDGALYYLSRTGGAPAKKSMANIALRQAQANQGADRLRYLNTYLEIMSQLLQLPAASRQPEDFREAGKAALELGKVDVAVNYLRTYLRLSPEATDAQPHLLRALILTGDASEEAQVKSLYSKCLQATPATETVDIRLDYVRYLVALQQWDETQRVLKEVESLVPTDGRPARFRAQVAYQTGNYEDCIASARRAMELDPSMRDVGIVLIGSAQLKSGSLEQARKSFDEYIESSTESRALRFFEVGEIYRNGNQAKEGLEYWEKALSLNADNDTLRYEIGRAHFQTGSLERAADHFQKVAEHTENIETKTGSQILLAYIRSIQGATQEAENRYRQALENSPNNQWALSGLAHLLSDQERYSEAKDFFEQAVAGQPGDATLLIQLGITCDHLDDLECAERAAMQAIEADPKYAEAYNFLGYYYAERGIKLDKALELIGKAIELEPNDPNITDSLGWAYYQSGEVQKAIEVLERAVSLIEEKDAFGSSVILEHLGDAYLKAGNIEKAREFWQKAAQGAPKSDTALEKLSSHQPVSSTR